MEAFSTPPASWCFRQMLSSHRKSCLRLLLAAWLHRMCMASQGIRETAEGREQPARRGYGGIPSASLLSQRFWAARLLQEADGQQGLKRCQRKSTGRYQARKSLAKVKAVGWSPARGMRTGKHSRVRL